MCRVFGLFVRSDLLHLGSEPIMKMVRKMTAIEADDE